jgi:hypothetical protein
VLSFWRQEKQTAAFSLDQGPCFRVVIYTERTLTIPADLSCSK